MTFQRPELLVLAPLAALLFALALGAQWRRLRRLERSYDPAVVRRLFPLRLDRFPTARLAYQVIAGAAIGLAAAGPLWLTPEPPEPPPPLDVALAVDLSLSMSAEDAGSSRIEHVRAAIALLTEELPSVRYSIVVFAGWPYTLLPPTDDPAVVRYFTGSLQPEVVAERDRGSSLAGTLELARQTLNGRPSPDGRQAILLFSDGDVIEDESSLTSAARAAADAGLQVWVAGVGTEDGAPLVIEGEPVQDASGRVVVARQNADLLRNVAAAGNGEYKDITDEGGLLSLITELADVSGDVDEAPTPPFDATSLLSLLAIPLLLWEGAGDAGRAGAAARDSRPRR